MYRRVRMYVEGKMWVFVRDVIFCGCKKESIPAHVRVSVCVSVLIPPVKMILQPSLISSTLSKQRKRRLVTPPPLLLSVSPFYPLIQVCICVCICVHAGVCGLSGLRKAA